LSLAEPALAAPAAAPGSRHRAGPLVLIAWLAVTVAALLGGKPVLDVMSTDDFMRLAMVRDFLAGQNWFDVTQYRLDPPAGVAMHWSRLADLPLSGIILALAPIVGREAAELVAIAAWPALLLLPVLALAAHIAGRLGGRTAALAAVPLVAVSLPVLVHFRPGGIDHHGLQVLLLLAATAGAIERERHLAIVGGGLAAAASVAIGLEMLPALAALLAAIGLRWVTEGEMVARATSDFALAFAVATAALFAATVPTSAWGAPVCDALATPWLAAAGLSGGGLALLAAASPRLKRRPARLAAGALTAAAAVAMVSLAFPACLGNPYASLDPRMAELWLASVYEAQSFVALVRNMPDQVLPFYGAPFVALVLGGVAMFRAKPQERMLLLAPMLVLLALAGVAMWQMRGAAAANLFAQIVLAASLVRPLGTGADRRSRIRLLAAFVGVSGPVLVLAGQAVGAAAKTFDPLRAAVVHEGPGTCRSARDVAPLQELPPGRVLSFIDLGPLILAQTPHSVLAAPYHRNGAGNTAAIDMLTGDDTVARRTLAQRRVDYVAICPGAPERIRYERVAPAGLGARLARGEVPDYLEALPDKPGAAMRVFRVRR
jgi:hypothetical protein